MIKRSTKVERKIKKKEKEEKEMKNALVLKLLVGPQKYGPGLTEYS
jgi:hypothetical protein